MIHRQHRINKSVNFFMCQQRKAKLSKGPLSKSNEPILYPIDH